MSNIGALKEIKLKLDNLIDKTSGYWPFSIVKQQTGGGFWSFLLGEEDDESIIVKHSSNDDGGDKIGSLWTKSINSEKRVIDAYEDLMVAMRKYYKEYDAHIDNIDKLGYKAHFDSLEYIFKNILIKEQFKPYTKVDRSNPLLLRNYLVAPTSTPLSLKKNHVLQQVYYKLRGDFSPNEQSLIKDIQVALTGIDRVQLIFRTADKQIYSRSVEHKRLNLHLSEVRTILKDIIDVVKSNISFKDAMFFESPQKKYEFKHISASKRRKQDAIDYLNFRKTKKSIITPAYIKKSMSKKSMSKKSIGKKSLSKKLLSKQINSIKHMNNRVKMPYQPDITDDSSLLFSDDIKGLSKSYTTGAKVSLMKKQRSKTQNQDLESDIKFEPIMKPGEIRRILEKDKDLSFAANSNKFENVQDINAMKEKLMGLDKDEIEKSIAHRKLSKIQSKLYDRMDSKAPANLPKPPQQPAKDGQQQKEGQQPAKDGQQQRDGKIPPLPDGKRPDLDELAGKAGVEKATPTGKAEIPAPNQQQQQQQQQQKQQQQQQKQPDKIKKCKDIKDQNECLSMPNCVFENNKCSFKK